LGLGEEGVVVGIGHLCFSQSGGEIARVSDTLEFS
jgi:hypothetical protein